MTERARGPATERAEGAMTRAVENGSTSLPSLGPRCSRTATDNDRHLRALRRDEVRGDVAEGAAMLRHMIFAALATALGTLAWSVVLALLAFRQRRSPDGMHPMRAGGAQLADMRPAAAGADSERGPAVSRRLCCEKCGKPAGRRLLYACSPQGEPAEYGRFVWGTARFPQPEQRVLTFNGKPIPLPLDTYGCDVCGAAIPPGARACAESLWTEEMPEPRAWEMDFLVPETAKES